MARRDQHGIASGCACTRSTSPVHHAQGRTTRPLRMRRCDEESGVDSVPPAWTGQDSPKWTIGFAVRDLARRRCPSPPDIFSPYSRRVRTRGARPDGSGSWCPDISRLERLFHTIPRRSSEYNLVRDSRLIRGRFALTRRRAGGCGCPSPDFRRSAGHSSGSQLHRHPQESCPVPGRTGSTADCGHAEATQALAHVPQRSDVRRPRGAGADRDGRDGSARPRPSLIYAETTEKSEVPLVFGVDDPSGAGPTRAQALAGDSMGGAPLRCPTVIAGRHGDGGAPGLGRAA